MLTPEQRQARIGVLAPQIEKLRGYDRPTSAQSTQLATLEREDRELRAAAMLDGIRSGELSLIRGTALDYDDGPARAPWSEFRGRALDVIDATARAGLGLPSASLELATRAVESDDASDGVAAWVLAAGSAEYRSAFSKLIGDPATGAHLWTAEERAAVQRAKGYTRAMNITDNPGGGWLVPFALDPTIVLAGSGSADPMRDLARVVTVASDVWHGVSTLGVTARWAAEATQAVDGSPVLEQPAIPIFRADAFVPFSFELQGDAPNLIQELGQLFADAKSQLEATAFTSGNGTTQPKGIVTALATVPESKVATAAADTIVANDVVGLQSALGPRWQPNATFMTSLAVANAVGSLETSNGSLRFPEIAAGRLLNRPLRENSHLDAPGRTAGTGNDFVAIYGDFRNYVIADRVGSVVELIPNLFGVNGRPTGQRGLFLWWRVGADVIVPNAFRVLTA